MNARGTAGFSLIEALVVLALSGVLMAGLATVLVDSAAINKSQQLAADTQANARNALSVLEQTLRSAGWDPELAGIPAVVLDPDPGDDISQIEVFADFDGDGLTDTSGEQVLIRHVGDRLEWRRSAGEPFETLAVDISNDADGDGTPEPLFTPIPAVDPSRIRIRITARSPVPDPTSREFRRYTVDGDVTLRKRL